MKRMVISLITIIIIVSGAVFVSAYVTKSENIANESNGYRQAAVSDKAMIKQTSIPFTEADLTTLTEAYLTYIKQEIDDDYRLVHVATIAELYEQFDQVAMRDVSEPHVSYYFTETEEGVYLRPTELPPWFEKDIPYGLTKVSDKEVIVEQTVKNIELYGPYRIQLRFNYTDQWRMSQVDLHSSQLND